MDGREGMDKLTMKASELRIGNWVYQGIEVPTQVVYNSVALFFVGSIELKPIRLTPEWLEKFGFEKERINVYWKDPMRLVIFPDGLLYLANQRHVNIYYVHQLQNLYFALTGNELTLNDHEQHH
ncbi:MAG TPA: hypothetical protein PKN99_11085 [Cyclobacteriaceae bacterium]|nr:hypothetical protein [Cyclobacteriaceae bacterium]